MATPLLRQSRRRGSVLLTTLLAVVLIAMMLGAILPLTVTGYGLSRADRDRTAALAAAEAGLNWEIGRINNRLWDKDDSGATAMDGTGNAALDYWPTPTGAAPSSASTVTLLSDASGRWTERFVVGTSVNPFSLTTGGTLVITAEGQVQAVDGHVVRRRVQCGGGTLSSLFDTAAIFALSTSSTSAAWSMGGSSAVVGGSGSNGPIAGNGTPSISNSSSRTGGDPALPKVPLGLWGSNASITGVTLNQVQQYTRSSVFVTDTADEAANNLPLTGSGAGGTGVARWAPRTDASGNVIGPADKYGRIVNSQAEIVSSSGAVTPLAAKEFFDGKKQPVLDHSLKAFKGSSRLRLKPGVYYFAQINLNPGDTVEVDNAYYQANGLTPLIGAGTAADYNSDGNRVTIFVDDLSGYADSSISSGMYTTLQGSSRRPGNFRIYAKNHGRFDVGGSNSSSFEFNANLLHYNKDSSGSYYGQVSLGSGCHLYGGLFGWTIDMSGSAIVEQFGSGVFSGTDPVTVAPAGGSGRSGSASGAGGGVGGGFGGWQWQEIAQANHEETITISHPAGFSLIEALMVAALLGVSAAGATRIWSLCYALNNETRQMQAGKEILEQEIERVRRLNWTGLPEQTSYTTRYCYDSGGNPAGTSAVTGGYVAYIKAETMNSDALQLAGTPTVDAGGGNSRSLRRVTIVVQPTGVNATATPPTAQAVTYLTLGGP